VFTRSHVAPSVAIDLIISGSHRFSHSAQVFVSHLKYKMFRISQKQFLFVWALTAFGVIAQDSAHQFEELIHSSRRLQGACVCDKYSSALGSAKLDLFAEIVPYLEKCPDFGCVADVTRLPAYNAMSIRALARRQTVLFTCFQS
jgi:hypothetical protein